MTTKLSQTTEHWTDSDKVHVLADPGLESLLDVPPVRLAELETACAARAGAAPVTSSGQVVVMLPGSVSHQVGVVGRGGVGDRPASKDLNYSLDTVEHLGAPR